MAKLITVFGATGRQGGGVAKALLKSGRPGFKVRAVTRNASSDKAKALQAKGAEVVMASLDDPSTLGPALRGAHGVFAVTNYWEHMDKEREIKQGKAIADAAKAAGVLHVVFSGLENVQKIAGFPCPVFDGKAEIEEYMTSIELPVTFVRYPSYYENFIGSLKPQKQDDGTYVLGIPMEGAAKDNASPADMGPAVRAIFSNRAEWLGRTVGFSGDRLTVQQHAEILSKHLAPKVFKATDMTADEYAQLGSPGAEDLANMFKFFQLYSRDRSVELTRQLHPAAKSFDTWVAENEEALLNALD
ncbi:nmrA-like family domain-containing protein 1 isoform X1 [Branchiostoma floridae x Branchiostoma japonicum]